MGILFVVSGPSGCGKSTIISEAMHRDKNLCFSVSVTTRNMREGESEGQHYYYISESEFLNKVHMGELYEYTQIYGHYYGTLRAEVERLNSSGLDVILDVDTSGALQIMSAGASAAFIFIMPPTLETLRERLIKRGTDSDEELERRMATAESEMMVKDAYDYIIVNGDLEASILNFLSIINRCRAYPPIEREWD